jgi:predicted Zn-ribbon and HTH transcriptional regulator
MVVLRSDVKACVDCGCIFSRTNNRNNTGCPVCKSMKGDAIEGIHF